MNIAEHIERGSREFPERIALVFEGCAIAYQELDELSSRAAGAFHSAGIEAGDRVALFLPNIPEFAIAYLGALKLGAIAVSMNASLKENEAAFILADSGAKVVVTTSERGERIRPGAVDRVFIVGGDFEAALATAAAIPAAKAMAPNDPAAIVYTSGTTGEPKGATLSHANVIHNIEAKRRYLGIRPEDRALLTLPLYHCFGQNAVLNAFLQAGATIVLHRRFDLDQAMQSIARDGVTMFFGVPATYILLLDKVARRDLAALRYYFSAAASLPLEIEERWRAKFGSPIFQGYGLTETSPFASYNHLTNHRPGSIGTPIEGVEIKIVDPVTGKDAAPGEKGEIAIRGHNVMLGYWNRPQDTAKCIRDGWFHTGDIGSMDEGGYFFLHDRLTDMIVSGGVNVYPAEVENALAGHPDVLEAAVYGVPEPLLGEQVRADIVLKPGQTTSEAEIRTFCRECLSPVKVPAQIRFVTEIPRNPSGKVLKRVLRERALMENDPAPQKRIEVTHAEAERWIRAWLQTNLDSPAAANPGSRNTFADLGMDSILSVRLAQELGDWLGSTIEVSAAWSFPTIDAMARHAAARSGGIRAQRTNDDMAALSNEAADALLLAELESISR
jgi:long-chain acyl-CoA synthetase